MYLKLNVYLIIDIIIEELKQLFYTLLPLIDGSERGLSYADGVVLPKTPEEKDFNECCYDYPVFASTTDATDYKNDYNGFYFQRQTGGDTCDFILVEEDGTTHTITDDTYGFFKDFGDIDNNSELKTFVVLWNSVINSLGVGCYTIKLSKNIAGVVSETESLGFNLKEFTSEKADGTVRIDCLQDGELRHYKTNFKGSEFKDSLRFSGFFGNRNPTYEEDSIVFANDVDTQISMIQNNEYICNSELLPNEYTTKLFDFILFGNSIFANDYNSDNSNYDYIKFPVKFDSTEEVKHYRKNRNQKISLKFVDRNKDRRKTNC